MFFRFSNDGLALKLEDVFRREGYITSGPRISTYNRDCRTTYRLTSEGREHKVQIRPFVEVQDLELFDRL